MAHTCSNKCRSFPQCLVPPYLATIIINEVDLNAETVDSSARRKMNSFRVEGETLDPEIGDAGESLSLGILDSWGRALGGIDGQIVQPVQTSF